MANKSDSISTASFQLTIAKGLNSLLVFGGTALFARLIGADQLGTYFLFERLMGLLVVFSNFGLSGALEKRLSEGIDQEDYLATVAVMKVGIVSVLAIAILAARTQINSYLEADLAVLLIVAVALRESGRLFLHTLRGERRVGVTSYLLTAKQLAWVGVGSALSATGLGYLAPVYGLFVGLAAILILAYVLVGVEFGRPSMAHAKSLFAFSKFDFVSSSIGWQVYNSADTLLIGYFLTTVAVSQYEIAWRISTMVMIVTASTSKVIFPSFSEFVTEEEYERITKVVRWSLGIGFLITIPSLVGVVIVGEPLLEYLFGSEYASVGLVLTVLVADKLSHGVQAVLAQVVRAFDRPDISAGITGLAIVANVSLNILLIPPFGLIGAAAATASSHTLGTVLYVVIVRDMITLEYPYRIVSWQVLGASVMGVVVYGLQSAHPINSIVTLLLYILVGVVVYAGITAAHGDTRNLIIREFIDPE